MIFLIGNDLLPALMISWVINNLYSYYKESFKSALSTPNYKIVCITQIEIKIIKIGLFLKK